MPAYYGASSQASSFVRPSFIAARLLRKMFRNQKEPGCGLSEKDVVDGSLLAQGFPQYNTYNLRLILKGASSICQGTSVRNLKAKAC